MAARKSWKTNTGASMVAVGGVLVSMADGCPISNLVYWIKMVGSIMMALGGAFAAYGLGDKIDRGNVAAKADMQKQIRTLDTDATK